MIISISIRNYALIEKLDIDISKGLNIITGETGAGKSIILGSLELLMGKRAEHNVLFDKDKKCVVEAVFDISAYDLEPFFIENDIDYSDELIIRRVISPTGKSRAFANDEPVNLKVLKSLASSLVQIHRQFDSQDINDSSYQLKLIDEYAGNGSLLDEYRTIYNGWKKNKKERKKLLEEQVGFSKDMELVKYQYDELEVVNMTKEEFLQLEDEYNNLANAETIKSTLSEAYNGLVDDEYSVSNRLDPLLSEVQSIDLRDKEFIELKERFYDAVENLRDIANGFYKIAENTEHDESLINELKERLDVLNNLMNKHKVKSIEELLEVKKSLEGKLQRSFNVEQEIADLDKSIEKKYSELLKLAAKLTARREKYGKEFCSRIQDYLKDLAMPNARLKVKIGKLEELGEKGIDDLELLFVANKGGEFNSLKNVASGGELSRLALSINAVVAKKMALPTMILDEIEAGISGEVAKKMGVMLKDISQNHQLISITHSTLIASKGDKHYFVYKISDKNQTKTNIRLLSEQDRVEELAKMISGDPPTEAALKNAKELISEN